MEKSLYPIFVDLAGQAVLVVGGGAVGLRKTTGLAECGAAVTVLSKTFAPDFIAHPNVRCVAESYASSFLAANQSSPWRLVFAATDQSDVNARIFQDANTLGILCCRCDQPEQGAFTGAAVWRREGIVLAVGTQGSSPGLAVKIRDQVARAIDPVWADFSGLLRLWRERVKTSIREPAVRQALLGRIIGGEMEDILRKEGPAAADRAFTLWLEQARCAPIASVTEDVALFQRRNGDDAA